MRAKLKLVADENMPLVERLFGNIAEVQRVDGRSMNSALLRDADILLVRSVTQVNAALLNEATRLKFLGTATIGTDHIDTEYLATRDLDFSSAPGCNAEAVVDYVISSVWHHAKVKKRDPQQLTYGVIGCGNVGSRLVRRLQSLDCQVLASDPPRAMIDASFTDTPLEILLSRADVICCHTPLVTEGDYPTLHLIDAAKLRSLKAQALIINAGRGAVIDSQALLDALLERPDIDAVLDVWENEPRVDSVLAQRVFLATPHIAGHSLDGKIRGTWMLYESFCRILNIEIEHRLSDVIPEPVVAGLELSTEVDPLLPMQLVYDQWRDDRAFRVSLADDSALQTRNFDLLRKRYPVRREFSSLTLSGVSATQKRLFQGLGFVLDAERV